VPNASTATNRKLTDWNTLPKKASRTPCETAKKSKHPSPTTDDRIVFPCAVDYHECRQARDPKPALGARLFGYDSAR
jgi:hypothetical protein